MPRFFAATAYLDEGSLRKAHAHAVALVAQYVEARVGKKPPLEKAENALVIATVLQEHLARCEGSAAPESYLRARRDLLRSAKGF